MSQSKIIRRGYFWCKSSSSCSLPQPQICLFRPKSFCLKAKSHDRHKDVPLKLLLHMVQPMSPFPRKCSLFISFSSMLSSISQTKGASSHPPSWTSKSKSTSSTRPMSRITSSAPPPSRRWQAGQPGRSRSGRRCPPPWCSSPDEPPGEKTMHIAPSTWIEGTLRSSS